MKMGFEKGKKRTGGRKPGAGNKKTAALRPLAQQYTVEALAGLVNIARDVLAPHAVRVQAWNAVLDRGHGRPPQALDAGDAKVGIIAVRWLGDGEGEKAQPALIDSTHFRE